MKGLVALVGMRRDEMGMIDVVSKGGHGLTKIHGFINRRRMSI